MLKVKLNNLCCANCANKIKNKVDKLKYVENSSLNFFTKVFYVELADDSKKEMIFEQIQEITKGIDPDVAVEKI